MKRYIEQKNDRGTAIAGTIRMKRLLKKLFRIRTRTYKEYHITNIAFGCVE